MISDHKKIDVSIPKKEKIEVQKYTEKQGQYLAFIYYYMKINGQSPAEIDMQRYFNVSPPSVHRMVMELEKKKLIERVKGKARSLKIKLDVAQLPQLI